MKRFVAIHYSFDTNIIINQKIVMNIWYKCVKRKSLKRSQMLQYSLIIDSIDVRVKRLRHKLWDNTWIAWYDSVWLIDDKIHLKNHS